MHACVLSRVWLTVTLWTVAQQAPLSMAFSRQEYWTRLPSLLPGDLPDSGIEPTSAVVPASQADSLLPSYWRIPLLCSSVQFSRSVVSDSLQSHGLQHSRPPWSITTSQSLLKLMSFELVMPSNHFILCRPLLLLPSIFPRIRVFSNESVLCIRWPKYWSFSFNISPSNEHSGLISFRMDWLDLLAVQGTLKSLLQHHSSKASIFSAHKHG